jgi:hypothetical protein
LTTEPDGRRVEYWLAGSVETDDHFSWVSARHPEYQIGGSNICTSCRLGSVHFTPFADPKDVSRLTDLNFTCFTRWRHCTEQADVLPAPWKEMRAEVPEDRQNGPDPCSLDTIRVLSRTPSVAGSGYRSRYVRGVSRGRPTIVCGGGSSISRSHSRESECSPPGRWRRMDQPRSSGEVALQLRTS